MISRPNEAALGDQPAVESADVRLVRVRADDDVDLGVEPVDDVDEVGPGEVLAAVRRPGSRAENGAFWIPPSCRSSTIGSTPCFFSRGTSALTVSASSRKSSPATPVGRDDQRRALERLADERDLRALPTSTIWYGGRSGLSVSVSITFAARYWKTEPRTASPSWQPSTGWQPSQLRTASAAALRALVELVVADADRVEPSSS